MKCETPSYVADFLTVISWHTDDGNVYYPGDDNGIKFGGVHLMDINLIKIGFIIESASDSYLTFHTITPNNMPIDHLCLYRRIVF